MPSLKEVRSGQASDVIARLANKRIFTQKKDNRSICLVELHMVDENGTEFALKSWNPKKAYYCWFNMKVGAFYLVTNVLEKFVNNADFSFSSVRYDVTGPWTMRQCAPIDIYKHMRCVTSYDKASRIIAKDRAINMLGKFLRMNKSSLAICTKRGIIVQGYEVHLLDENSVEFTVLVWHSPKFHGDEFPLFHFRRGETMLISAARTNTKYNDSINMTSLFPPLRKVSCVAPSRIGCL